MCGGALDKAPPCICHIMIVYDRIPYKEKCGGGACGGEGEFDQAPWNSADSLR